MQEINLRGGRGPRLVNGGGRQGQWQHKPHAPGCQNGTGIQRIGAVKTGVRDSARANGYRNIYAVHQGHKIKRKSVQMRITENYIMGRAG